MQSIFDTPNAVEFYVNAFDVKIAAGASPYPVSVRVLAASLRLFVSFVVGVWLAGTCCLFTWSTLPSFHRQT